MRMRIADARNLGGAFTADDNTYSAITIQNQSLVTLTDSVSFDEPTRGVFVKTSARFSVPRDETLTFASTLTLGGELWKEGAGTLALGGTVQFFDGAVRPDPVAGTNVVRVKAGLVRPVTTNGTDGIAFVFEDGAGLLLDASDDAGYGLYLAKSGSGLTADSASGKVPVSWSNAPAGTTTVTCPVLTAATTADLDALAAKLALGRLPRRTLRAQTVRSNADGTVTLLATFESSGMTLLIR